MSVWYEGNIFHRAWVEVHSGAVYRANTLDGCQIVVSGIPDQWIGNLVRNCEFHFVGGEPMAARFADAVAATDSELAEEIRAHPRRGKDRLN
jgi:hypothetical protein